MARHMHLPAVCADEQRALDSVRHLRYVRLVCLGVIQFVAWIRIALLPASSQPGIQLRYGVRAIGKVLHNYLYITIATDNNGVCFDFHCSSSQLAKYPYLNHCGRACGRYLIPFYQSDPPLTNRD
jgi:hypothetical protein